MKKKKKKKNKSKINNNIYHIELGCIKKDDGNIELLEISLCK